MADHNPLDSVFERLAGSESIAGDRASARLKARTFSALQRLQAESGPLRSVSETKVEGRALCVFEELVEILPAGEGVKSRNFCRVCHARVLGERFENPPIFWPHCPYVMFKKT